MSTTPAHALLPLLRCPRCAGALTAASGAFECAPCATAYPFVDAIPWMLPEPERALEAWRARQRALLGHLARQAAGYRGALGGVTRPLTRSRLKLMAQACDDHARRLRAVLAPLGAGEAASHAATYTALVAGAPGQGFAGYYANLHRDWCWGAAENEATLEAVRDALGVKPAGRTLVLGAGAGRLAYDLHEAPDGPAVTVALDVNPLLLFVARRMYTGERLELYEFPVAPRDLASHAVLRTLAAPHKARPGLELVFGDALRPPWAPGSFDTVVTPWLVDVVDADLPQVAATLSRLLVPHGRWVCTGTLFFQQREVAHAYSTEEVAQVLVEAGFASPEFVHRKIPYLASPASRHARVEEIATFAAERRREVPQPSTAAARWGQDARVPVPLPEHVAHRTLALRIEAYVASLVDGRRSVAEIAARLVEERLLLPDEARSVVGEYLARMVDDPTRYDHAR